ncbi:peptide synthase-like condensation domain [Cryptosporidium canis]|uniref:Peptide synthase-like condensation domain n=1 Tax=Cryptosporidium canis TaxID=195482 RepID=A0A9D5DMR7_9CRYT|nr:peptide synthase-like condensation domain [Cryptosporidium canis]
MDSRAQIRALDVVETFWETFNELGNVIILNPIIVKSSFPIRLEVVKEAAKKMVQRHQSLRVRIVSKMTKSEGRETLKRYFVDLSDSAEVIVREELLSSPESQSKELEGEPVWENMLIKEQNEFFENENSPLWRIRMMKLGKTGDLYRTCFIGSFHHAIMDGLSRQYFWTELLGLCVLSNEFPEIDIPKNRVTTLPKSVCKYFPSSLKVKLLKPFYSWRATATQGVCLYRKLVAPFENPCNLEISRDLYADFKKSPRTSILPIKISNELLKKLMSKCKERKIQLNGAIEAVSALGLMGLIYELRENRIDRDSGDISELKDCERSSESGLDAELATTSLNLSCMNNCAPFSIGGGDCFNQGCDRNAVIPIRTMVAINCRRWVTKDNPSVCPETIKVVETDLMNALEVMQSNLSSETTTTTGLTDKSDEFAAKNDSPGSSNLNSGDENASSMENTEFCEISHASRTKSRGHSKEFFSSLNKINMSIAKLNSPSGDRLGSSWLKKAVSRVISPKNRKDKQIKTVGLGSYAVLMGLDMKVERDCMFDTEKMWELANNTNKKIHSIVDSKDPSAVTFEWHVISGKLFYLWSASFTECAIITHLGFIHDLANSPTRADKNRLLMQLGDPAIRPSSFLVSNGGLWDSSALQELVKRVNSGTAEQGVTMEVESSYSCVAQHNAGLNMFAHNIVTVNGELYWSLQYHTNITNKEVAQMYSNHIQKYINLLADS